jgi:hypothetical protein
MTETSGYIYFAIKTEDVLEMNDFNKFLSIQPTKFEKMFERGQVPKCTTWEYSTQKLTNPDYLKEIEKLISVLEPYKEEFRQLKLHYPQLNVVLQVVLYLGDETPALHFSKRTLDFLSYPAAVIDCDIYNAKPSPAS